MKQSEPMRHLHPVIQLRAQSVLQEQLFIRAKAHSRIPIIKCVGGSSIELCSIFRLEPNLDLSVPNISRIEHLQKRHKHLWLSLDWYAPIPSLHRCTEHGHISQPLSGSWYGFSSLGEKEHVEVVGLPYPGYSYSDCQLEILFFNSSILRLFFQRCCFPLKHVHPIPTLHL